MDLLILRASAELCFLRMYLKVYKLKYKDEFMEKRKKTVQLASSSQTVFVDRVHTLVFT